MTVVQPRLDEGMSVRAPSPPEKLARHKHPPTTMRQAFYALALLASGGAGE